MNLIAWILNFIIALLTAVNAICWGYAIKEVGNPKFSIEFLVTLVFNKWFILAMASAFIAALLSYAVLKDMGVLAGRFFLSMSTVATILACTVVLGEKPSIIEWIGVVLIMLGVILIGKF